MLTWVLTLLAAVTVYPGIIAKINIDYHNILRPIKSNQVSKNKTHTIYTKVCGHPFKLLDLAISATPVADRCIKSSTWPFNLHRQTLAVEWPYWRAQWHSMWHRDRMPPFQQVSFHISALLELPRSTVNAVIVKWKCLGATTAQTQSGRPHMLTERDHQVLKRVKMVCPRLQHSLPISKLPRDTTSAQEPFVGSFMKWVSTAEQPHTSLRSQCAIPSVGLSGVKLAVIELWSGGNMFSGVMNHTSPSGSPTDKSGFGRCQENATWPNA